MIREQLKDFKGLDHDPDFRWRGTNVTRIENLSDIAFAIALGMIISGVDAPKTYMELREFLFYLVPTGAAFAVMLQIWRIHYTFFRRYGVADQYIIRLNAGLIFVVLYLAYPLWFTFSALYSWIIGQSTNDYSKAIEMGMTSNNSVKTICFFVTGYACSQIIFALMYGHVIRKRALLQLDEHELVSTRETHIGLWWSAAISIAVVPIAMFTALGPFATFLLFLQNPGYWIGRKFLNRSTKAQETHSET